MGGLKKELVLTAPSGESGAQAIRHLRETRLGDIHFEYVSALTDRLRDLEGFTPPPRLRHEYHLVRVPEGQELEAINRILNLYNGKSGYGRIVAAEPNVWARISSPGPLDTPFTPGNDHTTYWKMMKLDRVPSTVSGKGVKIAIIDNGIDSSCVSPSLYYDVELSPPGPGTPNLTNGHGNAMATLIKGVAPDAEISAIKSDDSSGDISLWNILTAVHIAALEIKTDIVNMSVGINNIPLTCPHCGASKLVRLLAYDHLLDDIAKISPAANGPPIYVAATGNDRKTSDFDFPASQGQTVAVGSVNAKSYRSDFTNYGTANHKWHVMAPGGEKSGNSVTENVGESQNHEKCYGTSPATAYVSGALALLRSETRYRTLNSDVFLDKVMRDHCDPPPSGSSSLEYGSGLIVYVKTGASGSQNDNSSQSGTACDDAEQTVSLVKSLNKIEVFSDRVVIGDLSIPIPLERRRE